MLIRSNQKASKRMPLRKTRSKRKKKIMKFKTISKRRIALIIAREATKD